MEGRAARVLRHAHLQPGGGGPVRRAVARAPVWDDGSARALPRCAGGARAAATGKPCRQGPGADRACAGCDVRCAAPAGSAPARQCGGFHGARPSGSAGPCCRRAFPSRSRRLSGGRGRVMNQALESSRWVLAFEEPGGRALPVVGGKGASLGEMAGAGLPVPPGFCVTTVAFSSFLAGCPEAPELLAALDAVEPEDVEGVRRVGQRVRQRLSDVAVPEAVARAVVAAWRGLGTEHAYAVRSSATLEDLPDASFAGQQDTFLNVRGEQALLERVRGCWVSLFTDRAILYRRQHGYPSSAARLAVVVQRMVSPEVSGILFTADPLSGNRNVCSIDASYGLGEALVSGLVNADLYRARKATGEVLEVRLGDKAIALWPAPGGGTEQRPVPPEQGRARALDDATVARLVEVGRRIEVLRGGPQDIEWCLEGGQLYVVQSRPITTLYPVPEPAPSDGALHVYLSFGHAQVNTAVFPPMALCLPPLLLPFGRRRSDGGAELMVQAGGRLYVDLTPLLHRAPFSRLAPRLLDSVVIGTAERLASIQSRPEFLEGRTRVAARLGPLVGALRPLFSRVRRRLLHAKPEEARAGLEAAMESRLGKWSRGFQELAPGAPRLRFFRQEVSTVFREVLLTEAAPAIASGLMSWKLVGTLVRGRVDERTLQAVVRGLEGNVTTDMDLALGDVADVARETPAVASRLRDATSASIIEELRGVAEAGRFLSAWDDFIARYGHRCPGELDIALPRWSEDPSSLLRVLSGMLHSDVSGEHRRRHAAALREAELATERILEVAGQGPLGFLRRRMARGLVAKARAYLSLREHPKFLFIRLFQHGREAILEAGRQAVERGLLVDISDVWMLELDELIALMEGHTEGVRERVAARRETWKRYARLSPPPMLTSEGEIPPLAASSGPETPGVLKGMGASVGVVEGTARVVLDPAREVLRPGEILVAPFTDPGWTPLFIHARALVMEVGGLMTHGSVVAREYGLPAVVGVTGATQRIHTGQRLRVDGDRGQVVLLESTSAEAA
ncbi:phosphoenolpyruvate synthase [Archangium violaceum]|nr:phosphoenolpyruvate synthase [Archangium violaceum]